MIVKHKCLNYSERVLKSVIDKCNKNFKGLDGILEVFNNTREQGFVLKIYDSYDPTYDTCIWVFEIPLQDQLNVIFGNRKDCTIDNQWNEEMFKSRITFDSLQTKNIINMIYDYIKEKYYKDIDYDIKLNIQGGNYIDKDEKYTLGELISCIGSLVKEYEENLLIKKDVPIEDNRLLKTKDVINQYPILTQYTITKAVQDKKLVYTKVGNTNYFRVKDIEDFINSGKKEIVD